jgi:plastocyanin
MKAAIAIVIAIIVVAGGYFLFVQKTQAPVQNPQTVESGTSAPLETTNPTAGTVETGSSAAAGMGAAGQQPVTVTYTDSGFSPKSVSITAGTPVTFVNNSSHSMWVASDNHPSHTLYDGTTLQQHCATKTSFDECSAASAGQTYTFTFTKAGTFEYHNHARANDTGAVVVK